jgi:hypothetical protein
MRVWEIAHNNPDVVGLATDGIISQSPISEKFGEGLGEWGESGNAENSIILGNGRYLHRRNGEDEIVLRGFPKIGNLRSKLAKCRESHLGVTALKANSALGWAWHGGDYNVLADDERILTVGDTKRDWNFPEKFTLADLTKGMVYSKPWTLEN